jgi:hypothetical protein
MPTPPPYLTEIDAALQGSRQGDVILGSDLDFVHVASLRQPITDAATASAEELKDGQGSDLAYITTAAPGFVFLTQTCDIVRSCETRPYIELAPLMAVSLLELENIRRKKRPNFAYIPAIAEQQLVAHLDRTFTVEKAVLAPLSRTPGVRTHQEAIDFAEALARKRRRFAFPDDFDHALKKLGKRFDARAGKQTEEGHHVDALTEIRVSALPSWEATNVDLSFWLIKKDDPDPEKWTYYLEQWHALIDQSGRYKVPDPFRVVRFNDITAQDYLDSQRLDFDDLSST